MYKKYKISLISLLLLPLLGSSDLISSWFNNSEYSDEQQKIKNLFDGVDPVSEDFDLTYSG